MALGKTIITTEMGKEGIHAENGIHLLEASDVDGFVHTISEILDGKIDTNKIGLEARQFVMDHYDHGVNASKLLEKYRHLMSDPHYQKESNIV